MDLPQLADPTPSELARDRVRWLRSAFIAIGSILALTWIKLVEWTLGADFSVLGILPRAASGLLGIVTAPLLHGSFEHLAANALAILILLTLSLYAYPRASIRALPLIWLGSGVVTWLIGRSSLHLGASGITHGLMFFVFVMGVLRRDRPAIGTALAAFFLYGGMFLSIFPHDPHISWEAHLGGGVSGLVAALLWRRLDPAPERKRYSWDEDEERAALEGGDDEFSLPRPDVAPIWDGPSAGDPDPRRGVVLAFPQRSAGEPREPPTLH